MSNFLKHKMRSKSPGEIVGWVLLGIIGITALAILLGFIIMWLWNWLMPDIFGLTTITYWQAVGLFMLSKILISAGGGGGGKGHKSKKRGNHKCDGNSDKKNFSKWQHYDQFWQEEGNQSYKNYLERKEGISTDEPPIPEAN